MTRITIVSRIYWPEPSAASSFLAAVADELCAREHEVTVLTTRAPQPTSTGERRERIRRWPVLRDATGYVRGYVQYASFDAPVFFRLLFARRADVVFVEPPPTTGAAVRVAAALRRMPYVYDVADIWSDAVVNATSSTLVARVLQAVERFALAGAHALVTISEPVAERLAQLAVRTPVTVTGFGADTAAFQFQPDQPRENTFVYGGTYSEIHGASVLVRGFASLLRTHPDFRLRFIGNGTERDTLQALATELGIGDAVQFVPSMSTEALAGELNRATAALASLNPESNYEYAFTTKAYSALASGCPLLFAGPGPTTTLFESAPAGLRIGAAVAFDADEVARALAELADAPNTPAERRALAEWAHAEHSLSAVAGRVADVLEGAARSTRGHNAQ